MPGFTTRYAPPEVEPDTIRRPSPFDFWKPLIDGPGPMKEASSSPANSAVITSPPALNDDGFSVTFLARWSRKIPPWMPTSAGAWVRLGK